MAIGTTQDTPSDVDVYPPIVATGGGGGGTVNSVTAGDETIIIGGTATDPTVRANTTDDVVAGVDLTAGMYVTVYNNAGTPTARKADCSLGQVGRCDGFVVDTVLAGATVRVYYIGKNSHDSGKTAGDVWLGTGGASTQTPQTTTGYISQKIGTASSATEVEFNPSEDILIEDVHAVGVINGGYLKTITFTSSGTLNIPTGVTGGWLTAVGGGGGGASRGSALGGGGGGAGEAVVMQPIEVVSGAAYSVTIGAKGTGGTATASGTDGGDTILAAVQTWTVKGGKGGVNSGIGGSGGGIGGATGAAVGTAGSNGAIESIAFYGGASGGGGANVTSGAGGSGGATGGLNSGAAGGSTASTQGGGGGGASTIWGIGGAGGNGGSNGSSAASTSYGAGGGGSGGVTASSGTGGDGTKGYLMFMYVG